MLLKKGSCWLGDVSKVTDAPNMFWDMPARYHEQERRMAMDFDENGLYIFSSIFLKMSLQSLG